MISENLFIFGGGGVANPPKLEYLKIREKLLKFMYKSRIRENVIGPSENEVTRFRNGPSGHEVMNGPSSKIEGREKSVRRFMNDPG